MIIGGILVIAVADALSDALGMHISEESETNHSASELWQATLATFLAKFFFALSFILPVIFFELTTAIIICLIWGLSLIACLSYIIAKQQGSKPYQVILEHLLIAILVIIITHYIGDWIRTLA